MVAKKQRPRDPLMDALGTLDSPDLAQLTNWGRVAKALKIIRTVAPDLTPQEIARRAQNFRQHFPGATLTSTGLANHWGRCDTTPHVRPQGRQFFQLQERLEARRQELRQLEDPGTPYGRELTLQIRNLEAELYG